MGQEVTRTAVVNVSAPHYNLGARKAADHFGATYFDSDPGLFLYGFDHILISVIFSWHAPLARDIALRMKPIADVEAGGPGLFALKNWWKRETGLDPIIGLDQRFEQQRGNYKMTFASRGCPVGCWFCIVPKLEGRDFTFYPDFQLAPILCDNNLSALPDDFQEHIINRYKTERQPLRDANSGFEPRYFTEDTYTRWKSVLLGPWRFAFDEMKEAEDVERMARILHAESPKRKRVYCLIGNEPFQVCEERFRKIIEWGCEPYCQPLLPLNWLGGQIPARHDWTHQALKDFARWSNRFLWRKLPFAEYRRFQADRLDEPR